VNVDKSELFGEFLGRFFRERVGWYELVTGGEGDHLDGAFEFVEGFPDFAVLLLGGENFFCLVYLQVVLAVDECLYLVFVAHLDE
jgi:hypothetical protein